MNDLTIEEGNKIIAEFDGSWLKYPNHTDKNSGYSEWCYPHTHINYHSKCGILRDMKYHSSWDWLMPVVEKIESERDMYFRIERDWVYICRFNDYSGVVVKTNTFTHKGGKIYGVWLAVVELIEYYNKEQKAQVSDTTEAK